MNTKISRRTWSIVSVVVLLALAGCSPSALSTPTLAPVAAAIIETLPATEAAATPETGVVNVMAVDVEGNTSVDLVAFNAAIEAVPVTELSEAEAAALRFMREEEKLAHDVYVTLYATWNLPLFQNISGSEQTHTEAVLALLQRYGVADPAADNGVGVFTDPTLQALYDQLVAQGRQSLSDALQVGAAIEEIDILDLEKRSAETDKADILTVYANLTKGSRNHLRSFVKTLSRQVDETYAPQYLSEQAYAVIIAGDIERGNGQK